MTITALMPVYPRCGVRPVRGEGVYLYGENGEQYLDFAAGIAVNALGHGHPKLVEAIAKQAATLMHVSNLYGSPQGEHFAQRLVDLTFADTVFFTNSGAEAVECAIKTARRYHFANGNPQRHTLITFNNAFHGRTLGAISATNQPKMRDGFEPLLPGFAYAPFDDLEAALALIDDNTAGFWSSRSGAKAACARPHGIPARAAQSVRRAWLAAGAGRSAVRLRPHRQVLRP